MIPASYLSKDIYRDAFEREARLEPIQTHIVPRGGIRPLAFLADVLAGAATALAHAAQAPLFHSRRR